MLEAILTLLHGAVLLTFGIALSVAFAGIRFSKQNFLVFLGLFLGTKSTMIVSEKTVKRLVIIMLILSGAALIAGQLR